jgi:hypothetical protein
MAKTILFAVAMLLLGAVISNGITRYNAQQHQHTRAVMVLAQFPVSLVHRGQSRAVQRLCRGA